MQAELTHMARQLKDRVDLSLPSGSLAILGVTYPFFFGETYEVFIRNLMLIEVGFKPSLGYHQADSTIASAAANGIMVCRCPLSARACQTEHFQRNYMILYIDFSDTLLTMRLYNGNHPEDWDFGQPIFIEPSPPIGANNSEYWDHAVRALRMMVSQSTSTDVIDYLVLSGERADEEDLRNAIQSGVRSQHRFNPSSAQRANTPYRARIIDPAASAAYGVADLSWRRVLRVCLDPCTQWRLLPSCDEQRDNIPIRAFQDSNHKELTSELWHAFL